MPNLRIRRRSMGPSTIHEAQQLIARIRENGLEIYMEDFERRARPIEAYEGDLRGIDENAFERTLSAAESFIKDWEKIEAQTKGRIKNGKPVKMGKLQRFMLSVVAILGGRIENKEDEKMPLPEDCMTETEQEI